VHSSGCTLRLRLVLGIFLIAVPAAAQFPAPSGYVNDFAGLLDESAEAYLETYLGNVERDTSAEVVLVTVDTLGGTTIEDYASRLFADWGIGQARSDNGVLMLVAPNERRVRIEVGYGLEPILPDGRAGEIIRDVIVPEFTAGNYPRGIGRGLERIAMVVRRDPSAAALPPSVDGSDDLPLIFLIPFFGAFVVIGGFATGLGIRTRTYGALMVGALFAGIPGLIAVSTVSVTFLLILLPLELAAIALGLRRGRSPYWINMLRSGSPTQSRDADPSAWVMGGSDSSTAGSFDSGGSSGGSDFGGGSSGGGGASGRW
jgi:uncharacterized protein